MQRKGTNDMEKQTGIVVSRQECIVAVKSV